MIKNYRDFVLEEKFNLNNIDLILEKKTFSKYKDIQHKVLKEYGTQLYFVATFNSAIVSLYPVVYQIIMNSDLNIQISTYQIVLLTIFVIAEILHVNNEAINKIKNRLNDDGLIKYIKDIKNVIFSVEKIVKIISRTIGKTISLFTDMLGYVAILVPINEALVEILKQDGLDIETLPRKILGLGIGLGIITLKNIIIRILEKLGLHYPEIIKKVDVAIIDAKKNNIYHNMRTKEKLI